MPYDDSITFISYKLADCGTCLITNHPYIGNDCTSDTESTKSVAVILEKLFKDAEFRSKYIYFSFLMGMQIN